MLRIEVAPGKSPSRALPAGRAPATIRPNPGTSHVTASLPSVSFTHSARRLENALHTAVLLAGLLLLLGLIGWIVAGTFGVVAATLLSLFLWSSSQTISAQWLLLLMGARPLRREEAPALFAVAEALAARAGLPRPPALYYVATPILNAFTVGTREDARIAVTDGLLRTLTLEEVAGVLAHEIGHLLHDDTRVMSFADVVSRVTAFLSYFGQLALLWYLPVFLVTGQQAPWSVLLLLVFAPTISALLQLALSRSREYQADLAAAELTGRPEWLISALAKMERIQRGLFERLLFPGARLPEPSLLRTHPPTEERIRRLREWAQEYRGADLELPADRPLVGPSLTPARGRPRIRIFGPYR